MASDLIQELNSLKTLIDQSSYEPALAQGLSLLTNHPHDPELINLIAFCKTHLTSPLSAIQYLQQHLHNPLNTTHIFTLFQLATLSLQTQQHQQALDYFLSIDILTSHTLPPVLFQIAYVYEILHQEDKAVKYYQSCIFYSTSIESICNAHVMSMLNLSAIYIKRSMYTQADTLLKEYVNTHPEDLKAMNNYQIVLYNLNHHTIQTSISTHKETLHQLYNRAIHTHKKGQSQQALELFNNLIEQADKNDIELLVKSIVNIGLIYEARGEYANANSVYQKIVKESYENIDKEQFQKRILNNQERITHEKALKLGMGDNDDEIDKQKDIQQMKEQENEKNNHNKQQVQIKLNELENEKKLFEEFKIEQQLKIENELLEIQELKRQLAIKNQEKGKEILNSEVKQDQELQNVLNGQIAQNLSNQSKSDDKNEIAQSNIKANALQVNMSNDTLLSIQNKVFNNDQEQQLQKSQFSQSRVYKKQKSIPQFQSWDEETCLKKIAEEADNYFAYYQLALLNFNRQNLEETKKNLLKVHEIKPDFNIEKINKGLAEIYESEQQFDLALKHYKNTYIYTNDKLQIMLKIGKCYEKLQEQEQVIKSYETAIILDNKNYLGYFKLGSYYLKLLQTKKGTDNLQKAFTLQNTNIQVIQRLADGFLLEANEEWANKEAMHYLNLVLESDPDNYEALVGMGKVHEKRNELTLSIEYIERASKLVGPNINSLFYQGTLHMRNKSLDQAIILFQQVLTMQSTHVESMVELATVHLIKEESTKAREYFESALKLDNSNVIANLRIGKMYQIQMNNHRQALFHFDKVTEKDPLQFRAFFLAAHSQVELKESQKALASLKQCLKINSIYGPAWKLIGDILYEENNISNAAKYYKKSIELDPNDTESKVTLANCEYMLENYRSAIKLYEDIIKNDQSQDDIYYNLGNSYYMLNEFQPAINNYQISLTLKTDNTECYYNLGNAFCILEQFQEALHAFQNSIRLDKTNASAHYNIGNTQLILNNYEKAMISFEQCLGLQEGRENSLWCNYIGSVYLDKKELGNAERVYQIALRTDDKNIETRSGLVKLFLQKGDNVKAQSHQKVIKQLEDKGRQVKNKDKLNPQKKIAIHS